MAASFAVHGIGLALMIIAGFWNLGLLDPVVPYPPHRDVASIYVPPSNTQPPANTSPSIVAPLSPDKEVLPRSMLAPANTTLQRQTHESGELPAVYITSTEANTSEVPPAGDPAELVRAEMTEELDNDERRPLTASGAMSRASMGMDELVTPHVLVNPPARYPHSALLGRIQGTVVLRVGVAANGAVESARVARSSGSRALDEAALDAVGRWRFLPAMNERSGTRFVNVPFVFEIRRP